MTFLQLVQRLALESGITSASASVGSVLNQTGMAARFVNWIISAHNEIQNRHQNWRWLRSTWTVNTTASDDSYSYSDCTDSRLSSTISRFARWIPFDDEGGCNIKRYLTSGGVGGESWMVFLPWSYWQAIYRRGTQNNGPIIHVTISPQNLIMTGPKPDGIYTMSGEYMMSAKVFAADADEPEFPSRFHDLIWLQALEKYGRFAAAGEALARSQVEGRRVLRQLEADQLPQVMLAAPLA